MSGGPDTVARCWSLAVWRRAPAVVTVLAVVSVGLVFAVFDGRTRPFIIGPSVVLLDVAGAVYSWRAGRLSPSGTAPWRLIAAGRAASVLTTV